MSKRDKLVVGEPNARGLCPFVRQNADGTTEDGIIGGVEHLAEADVAVRLRREAPGSDTFEIVDEVRFTARSRPTSNAYRSGWDQLWGKTDETHAAN